MRWIKAQPRAVTGVRQVSVSIISASMTCAFRGAASWRRLSVNEHSLQFFLRKILTVHLEDQQPPLISRTPVTPLAIKSGSLIKFTASLLPTHPAGAGSAPL